MRSLAGGVRASVIRSTANDSPPQPDLRKPARWFQNSASETRVPSVRPLCPSPSSSDDSMLASKAFLPPPPAPGHVSHCHTSSTLSPGTPSLGTPPTGCWVCTQNHRAGRMQQWRRACSSPLGKGLAPSPLGRDRTGGHPSTLRRANRRKQTKNGGEPSGPEEEGRGSPGQWGSP